METRHKLKNSIITYLTPTIVACILMYIIFFVQIPELFSSAPNTLKENKATTEKVDPCKVYGISAIKNHAFLPEKYEILSMKPVNGLCEIALGTDSKYVTLYTHKDYVLVGDLFINQKAVTKDLVDKIEGRIIKENREELEKCTALTYEPKERNLKRTLYMVISPGCHFCSDAIDQIPVISDKYGLTVKVIVYSEDDPKSIEAVCRDFTFEEYASEGFKQDPVKEEYLCEKGRGLLHASTTVIDKIGIKGFPTFIFDTGTKFAGGNMPRLEQKIILYLASIEKELASK